MHEYSLHGSVPITRYPRVLKQLAGYTCMQPQEVREIHVIFKSRPPPGAIELQQGTGSSQAVSQIQQDAQKLKTMLQSGIYFVKMIGEVSTSKNEINWTFEFKDTPDAGKVKTTTRLISRTKFEDGKPIAFLNGFGFEYAHRYHVEGQRFYSNDTTIFLQRVRKLPALESGDDPLDYADISSFGELELLDDSQSYLIEASITTNDGKTDLRDSAEKQLLSVQADLSSAVKLEMPDRLSFDTRVPVTR